MAVPSALYAVDVGLLVVVTMTSFQEFCPQYIVVQVCTVWGGTKSSGSWARAAWELSTRPETPFWTVMSRSRGFSSKPAKVPQRLSFVTDSSARRELLEDSHIQESSRYSTLLNTKVHPFSSWSMLLAERFSPFSRAANE